MHSDSAALLDGAWSAGQHRRQMVACGVAALSIGIVLALGEPFSRFAPLLGALPLLLSIGLESPRITCGIALVALLLPLPGFVPVSAAVFTISIYVFDVLLFFALWALLRIESLASAKPGPLYAYLAAMALAFGVGVLNRFPLEAVTRELRPPVYLVLGVVIGLLYKETKNGSLAFRVAAFVLWYSAVGILISTATSVQILGGVVSSVESGATGFDSSGVTRFQIQSTMLALFCLCMCVCLPLTVPRLSRRMVLGIAVIAFPAALIVFFSFSRNTILALGVTLVVTLLFATRVERLLYVLPIAALIVVVAIAPLMIWDSQVGLFSPAVNKQFEGYSERVFAGLSGKAIKNDQGIELRKLENKYGLRAFLDSPLTGLGLGASYRPSLPRIDAQFPPGMGRTYVHNAFLWYLVKAGAIGLVALLVVLLGLFRGFSRDRQSNTTEAGLNLAATAALVGILAVNFVAPYLDTLYGAVLIGLVLGALKARRRAFV